MSKLSFIRFALLALFAFVTVQVSAQNGTDSKKPVANNVAPGGGGTTQGNGSGGKTAKSPNTVAKNAVPGGGGTTQGNGSGGKAAKSKKPVAKNAVPGGGGGANQGNGSGGK
jgi:hypothetical protein